MNTNLVTVFGGSGFLGRHTVRALAKAGYRIRVAVRYPHQAFFLKPMGQVGQIQILKANVQDEEQVTAAVFGAQIVINLTGILYARGHQSFEAVHVNGARTVARAAARAGATTLVQISAIGADAQSDSQYAQSKGRGEDAVREEFPSAVILRPSLMFGPEDSFFNRFAGYARFLPLLPLIGGGHTKFQPVFAGDVAAAILRCASDPAATRGKTYELGGPAVYSFRELMQIMLREIDRKRLLVPIPFALATLKAFFLQFLPSAPLTPDQVRLLKTDNIVPEGAAGLADLGIEPTSVEAEIPLYLWRFRPKGQFPNLGHGVSEASSTR